MFNVSYTTDDGEIEECFRTYIVGKPTTSYIVNSIIGCIANLVLCFVGSFLNALVVYVFWKTPRLRYKVSYFMIMLLSSIDFLVTSILHPANIVMSITEITGRAKCGYKSFYHVATIVLSGMSFLTFFVMNIERYLSIVHPIFHLRRVTKLRCLVVCIMFWTLAIFSGPVAYPLRWNVQLVITVTAVTVMLGTCYIYILIFYIARKKKQEFQNKKKNQEKALKTFATNDSRSMDCITSETETHSIENLDTIETQDHSGTATNNQEHDQAGENSEKSSKTVSFLHDLQLAKTYLLVVLCSFVLNIPNAIFLAVFQHTPKTVNGFVQSKQWTVTLVQMNSTVNCLIFFWANKRLSKEGWKAIKSICRG